MSFVKKVDTTNSETLQKSLQQGAEEFLTNSLTESGAINYLEEMEVKTTELKGSIGDKLYDAERLEHETKKVKTGRSCSVYFKRG